MRAAREVRVVDVDAGVDHADERVAALVDVPCRGEVLLGRPPLVRRAGRRAGDQLHERRVGRREPLGRAMLGGDRGDARVGAQPADELVRALPAPRAQRDEPDLRDLMPGQAATGPLGHGPRRFGGRIAGRGGAVREDEQPSRRRGSVGHRSEGRSQDGGHDEGGTPHWGIRSHLAAHNPAWTRNAV